MIAKKIYILIISVVLASCAKFVPPTGGERDNIPPKLIDSIPKNKETNYKKKEIWLKFDEYVDSKDLKQELIITPEPESKYKVKTKGDEITLEFQESLDSNTTYTFNFGAGIKDINERNKSDKVKIVFSTGAKLDSLSVGGEVKNLFTKESVIGATIGLYNIEEVDTIRLTARKPTYFVKSDSSGIYRFENLKKGKYKLLAFVDANKNIRFDNKKELFGFLADTLNLQKDTNGISIELYPYDTIAPRYKRFIQKENIYTLQFDEPLYNASVKFLSDSVNYTVEADEIRFFRTKQLMQDSIRVSVTVRDSLSNTELLDHKFVFKQVDENKKNTSEVVQFKILPSPGSPVLKNEEYKLTFNFPILQIDTSKLSVSNDTLNKVSYKLYYINSSQTQIGFTVTGVITENAIIKAEAGAFKNINGDTTSAFTIKNPIIKFSETGLLSGSIKGLVKDSVQYIFQLINYETGKIIKELISGENTFTFSNVLPNEYLIRVILDENLNGVWDTANFQKGKQPEKILLQKNAIKVKANFEFRDIIIEQ